MPATPPRVVCPLCSLDDHYALTLQGDATRWLYTCNGPGHEPYSWDRQVASPHPDAREGIMAELGLYDDWAAARFPDSDQRITYAA